MREEVLKGLSALGEIADPSDRALLSVVHREVFVKPPYGSFFSRRKEYIEHGRVLLFDIVGCHLVRLVGRGLAT